MEKHNLIEIKKKAKSAPQAEKAPTPEAAGKSDHTEAIAFVEQHRDYFEHYAKGKVKIAPAPEGLQTFAFNLEENTIYVNSMFYKKFGFGEEKTLFATLHEIEHFMEKKQILREEGGIKKFEKYVKRIKDSRAFGVMDNCVADIRENKTVVSRTNATMGELEQQVYREDLFPRTDFTAEPKHLQFCQAILREARVPGEPCTVASEVRTALDEVAEVPRLIEIMTNSDTPMSLRLRLQDKYVWPKVEALLEKDLEDKKEEKKKKKEDRAKEKEQEKKKEKGDNQKDEKEGEPNDQGKETGEPAQGEGDEEGGEGDSDNPDRVFAKEYDELDKKFTEAVPLEEIEKALKKWKETEEAKDTGEEADQEYADKLGVEKEYLQKYRKEVEALEKVINPETGESVLEELKQLFLRIISKRTKPQFAPRYPVTEGDELVDPAQLVADVRAGNLEPRVWEDTEIREKKGDKFGEVEITLVCDRSSSMAEGDGQKAVEQRRSAVLVMEALKDFADLCEEERMNVDHPLSVQSEIYTFSGSVEDSKPLKAMSSELGEAERINVLKKLYDLPGTTTDFVCLGAIDTSLTDEAKRKIQEGVLKKIVIIFTDGGSDKPAEVQARLKALRDAGIVAIGVGITASGAPVLTTYAPNALVVEDVAQLPAVLGDLLKEHLKDL